MNTPVTQEDRALAVESARRLAATRTLKGINDYLAKKNRLELIPRAVEVNRRMYYGFTVRNLAPGRNMRADSIVDYVLEKNGFYYTEVEEMTEEGPKRVRAWDFKGRGR